jgi:hypothetical protein
MATEVKLSPGWLLQDVRLAAARLEPSQNQLGEKTEVSSNHFASRERSQTKVRTKPSSHPDSSSHKG